MAEASSQFRFFDKDQSTLFFDPEAEPIAELGNGERVVVRTQDSVCGLVRRDQRGRHIDEVLNELGGACPVTGPFAVEGARPGNALVVDIHRVEPYPPAGVAWTALFAGFGALTSETYNLQPPLEPEGRLVPYADGVARIQLEDREVELPLRPFLGTVGVAPRRERRMTFSQDPEYLGDVDLPQLAAGAELVLPVNVEGGLLGLGDAHGAQGDGEITGVAIEIEAEVELTIRNMERAEAGFVALPQINTTETMGSVAAMYGVHLGDCARAAYADLVRRMVRFHKFREIDAYTLLGQVGRLQVGNMIDPFYSVLATIERRYLDV